uniref:Uncharacterized protein n=1 Tax=Psilocybe cubensis TaxID=181762 RepID=A0A8H7XRN0_PSICU
MDNNEEGVQGSQTVKPRTSESDAESFWECIRACKSFQSERSEGLKAEQETSRSSVRRSRDPESDSEVGNTTLPKQKHRKMSDSPSIARTKILAYPSKRVRRVQAFTRRSKTPDDSIDIAPTAVNVKIMSSLQRTFKTIDRVERLQRKRIMTLPENLEQERMVGDFVNGWFSNVQRQIRFDVEEEEDCISLEDNISTDCTDDVIEGDLSNSECGEDELFDDESDKNRE